MPEYDRCLKRIAKRDWPALQDRWLNEIGGMRWGSPGTQPEVALSDLPELSSAGKLLPATGEIREDIDGLRAAVLREAIFLLHKSAAVLVACHDQAVGGSSTWSLSTGYQCAFFAAEGILRLLGVIPLTIDKKSFTADIWPIPEQKLNKVKSELFLVGNEVQLVPWKAMSHFHIWAVFQECLRRTARLNFDSDLLQALTELDDHSFAQQRNNLHYSNTWSFGDLHGYCSPVDAFRFKSKNDILSRLVGTAGGFSVALCTTVLALAVKMLRDLSVNSPAILAEVDLLVFVSLAPRSKLGADFDSALGSRYLS